MSAKFDMVNCDSYRAACEIGADFYRGFVLTILDSEGVRVVRPLTGYTSKLQVKSVSGGTAILTPTMTVTATEGKVEARALASVTAGLTAGVYKYDWIITSPTGVVERILEGRFEISARITV
jgi:hypothetical protein